VQSVREPEEPGEEVPAVGVGRPGGEPRPVPVGDPEENGASLEQGAVRGFERRNQSVGIKHAVGGEVLLADTAVDQDRFEWDAGAQECEGDAERAVIEGVVQAIGHAGQHRA